MFRIRTWLLPALLLFAGCSNHDGYSRVSSSNAFVEQWNGEPAFVAWYRGGEILGADAVHDTDFPLHAWLHGRDVVDHPDLARWRRQLADQRMLAAAPDTAATDLMRAVVDFPFDGAVAESCSLWVGSRADRAAELLDLAADLGVDDAFAERLAVTALSADPGDERVAPWVRTLTEAGHDEAVLVLATSAVAGPRTAEVALADLGQYASQHRLAIFAAAARRVLVDTAMAWRIVAAAEELPSADEARALAALLDGDASAELALQVLRHLGDRPAGDRAMLFARAAERACGDPRSQFAIAEALRELPGTLRLEAARAVVARSDVPESLVVLVIDDVEHLRSSDREGFLLEVLDGPHGAAPDVRSACADAARRHLSSRPRERVQTRLDRDRR
jgi:hypothetical protein